MSLTDGRAYEIIEAPAFGDSLRNAVRSGLVSQMEAGLVFAEVRELLKQCPYRVKPFPDLPVDVRRISYGRRFYVWYSISEDDRSVCLEEVTPAYGS